MKKTVSLLLALLATTSGLLAAAVSGGVDPRIRLNSVGFTPDAPKLATIALGDLTAPPPAAEPVADEAAAEFRVVRVADGEVVWRGECGPVQTTAAADTGERVRVADFGALREPGRYALDVPGMGRSAEFEIGGDVWREPYWLVTRGLTLWRCGHPGGVHGEWRGQDFSHAACHLEDGWLDHVGGGHERRDGTGGWHDAGDYNKYVVNAGVSLGFILGAWEHFRPRIEGVGLDLPASDGLAGHMPDLLREVRWELEWLFKMQTEDGRVFHKLSSPDFRYWGPPDRDTDPRYYAGWGTAPTASFAAMMAQAARHYREFDEEFAARCLAAARRAWAVLEAHPQQVAPDQKAFSTGGYECSDATHRLWAAAELWAATGEKAFLAEVERRAAAMEFSLRGPGWGDVGDLGLGTYLETPSAQRDVALVRRLDAKLQARAAEIAATAARHAYGRPMGGEKGSWFWGASGCVAGQSYLLHLADRRRGGEPVYRATISHALAFLFGRNFHGRSYVTGLGHQPPAHLHDRRGEPAWPGYLVGGGADSGRSWVDELADYRQNEIALNWNAALIYALAAFVEPAPAPAPDSAAGS